MITLRWIWFAGAWYRLALFDKDALRYLWVIDNNMNVSCRLCLS